MWSGTRLAEVVYNNKNKPYFIPTKKNNIVWLDKNGKIFNKRSENKITNDVNRFPPFEFFWDIQDILKLFVGGKHSVQNFTHKPLKNLSKNLFKKIKKQVKERLKYSVTSVKNVLAIEMLKILYKNPCMNEIDFILDEFHS
jgi:hypothetical protein